MPWNLDQMTRGAQDRLQGPSRLLSHSSLLDKRFYFTAALRTGVPVGYLLFSFWQLIIQRIWSFFFFLCEISRKCQVSCSFKLCKHNISLGSFFFTREAPQLRQLDGNSDLCRARWTASEQVSLWFLVKAALPTALIPALTSLALFWLHLLFRQSLTM